MLTAEGGSDDGFTLVELLLCVVLMGIVGTAIVSSLLMMLRVQSSTDTTLSVSDDRQLVANYFSDDVAGAQTMSEGPQAVCGSPLTALVVFTGKDVPPGTTTSVTTTVAWSYRSATGQVVRTACRGGGPADVRTIANNVAPPPALAAETVSTSCTANQSVSAAPTARDVRLKLLQVGGSPLVICAQRRPL